jgi:hypothetical protein
MPLEVLNGMSQEKRDELLAASRKNSAEFDAKLNELGDQGWELVTVETTKTEIYPGSTVIAEVAYLKRMK